MLGEREYIVTFSVAHIGILEAMIVRFSMQRGKILLSILLTIVMCLRFSMQKKNINKRAYLNTKCQ